MGRIFKYNEAQQKIIQLIISMHLKAGDRLPSEHDLVDQLGVSIISVHRAMNALQDSGIITKKQGSGSFYEGKLCAEEHTSLVGIVNIGDHLFPDGRRMFELSEALKHRNATYKVFSVPHELDPSIQSDLEKCDRFIVTGFINQKWIDYLGTMNRPMVQIGHSDYDAHISKVQFDWYAAVDKVIVKLKEAGAVNIGFLLPDPMQNTHAMAIYKHFLEAMAANQLIPNPAFMQFVPQRDIAPVKALLEKSGDQLDAVLTVEPSTLLPLLCHSSYHGGLPSKLKVVVLQEVDFLPPDMLQYCPNVYDVFFQEPVMGKAIEILYDYPYSFLEKCEVYKLQPTVFTSDTIIN